MQIRRIRDTEYELVRDLRIAALSDAPDSFAESEQEAYARPNSYWVNLSRSLTEEHVMFVIEENGEARGSVYGIRDKDNTNGARVGGMWVASEYRARGLGSALLEALVEWAISQGFTQIRLWVRVDSPKAKAFYSKAGFEYTGNKKKVPSDSPFVVEEMLLNLSLSELGA